MTPPEVKSGLGEVQPGRLITDMRVRSAGGRAIKGLRMGLVPKGSPLDDEGIHTVVATNTMADPVKRVEVVAKLEEIEDGDKAEATFDVRNQLTGQNPALIREVLNNAGVEFKIRDFIVSDPEHSGVHPDVLDRAGFQEIADGSGRQQFTVYAVAA